MTLPEKLQSPSVLAIWPDQGTLVVGDAKGKHLWAFRCEKDGTLTAGEPYYALRLRTGEKESHVTALTVDTKGQGAVRDLVFKLNLACELASQRNNVSARGHRKQNSPAK